MNKEKPVMASAYLLEPKRFAVHDGPGIRTTFFVKGCPLHCRWCHNPESIAPAPQMACFAHKCLDCGECAAVCPQAAQTFSAGRHVWDKEKCVNCGKCADACLGGAMKLYGVLTTTDEALALALEDRAFYEQSGGGVTISGGEPLAHPEFTLEFLEKLKRNGIATALDTCALVNPENLRRALPLTDIFLVDFKHADSAAHRRLTGQDNTLIKENLQMLNDAGAKIEIRIPFIPGCNTDDENMEATGEFLGWLRLLAVKLLPYHALARAKYNALGMPDTLPAVEPPTDAEIARAVAILQRHHIPAVSGRE